MRWISSRKSTSPSDSVESTAARSPARSIAGPEEMRSGMPSSPAMIIASVVLPRPGGPDISRWPGGRPRRSALCSTSESCSRTRACPMNSSRRLGRSAASMTFSSPSATGETNRSSSFTDASPARSSAELSHRQLQQRGDVGGVLAVDLGGDRVDGRVRVACGPAEVGEAGVHLRAPRRRGEARHRAVAAVGRHAQAVLQLQHDALSALAADAGDLGQRVHVFGGDGAAQGVRRVHGEHREREARPDAARGLQPLEDGLLVLVGEAVESEGVLAHDERGGHGGLVADAQAGQRGGRAQHREPAAAHLARGAVGPRGGDPAVDECDHYRVLPCLRSCAAPAVRVRAAWRRAWAPPRQTWLMASASASAASAGLGGAASRSSLVSIVVTWSLSARPFPVTAALASLGVCWVFGWLCCVLLVLVLVLVWVVFFLV